ncbi:MAG: hypothetical protein EP335_17450 [Alphaproteobacteria bacterium]|nr:MAG: hypothetical protein EP335_17450 [Alphaproteobacteria bacterium]
MKSYLVASLVLASLSLPVAAQDKTDELSALREEVSAMRAEMMSLNSKLADMQSLLKDMNGTILKMRAAALEAEAATANAKDCETRLGDLKSKQDKLLSLGYRPEHPDLRNIAAVIKQLEATCGEAGTAQ